MYPKPAIEKFELAQVPYKENAHTCTRSMLASSRDFELRIIIPIEQLTRPSISKNEEVMWVEYTPPWMN